MTKKTAHQDKMETLHAQLAAVLTEVLTPKEKVIPAKTDEDGEEVSAERIETVFPSAAEMAVAAKFLKDNSIFSSPDQDEGMSEMRKKLHERERARKPTAQDKNDALATLGRDLLQ